MKKAKVKKQDPKVILVMGGVCSGKTTYINKEHSKNCTNIDAGKIFIELSKGEYYDFPSHLEDKLNKTGLKKLKTAIRKKEDIVIEVIGNNQELLNELINQIKKINYKIDLVNLTCSIEEAKQRNENRNDDSISAYYCEPYHLNWFRQIVSEHSFNAI